MLADDEVTELLKITVPRLHRRLGPGSSPAFDIEDLVQDALERALALEKAGRTIDSLPAWIQAVVLNLRRDEWRRIEAEARALGRAASERPGSGLASVDAATAVGVGAGDDAVLVMLGDLPVRQRQVLALHYYADLSVEAIARRLGIDPGTVKSTLHRGRRALAALLRPRDLASMTVRDAPEERPMIKPEPLPGWILAGSHPNEYEHGLVDGEHHDGRRVARMRCTVDQPGGFGTVMQIVDAGSYRGLRIRFSGFVQSTDVAQWAGLWMRVDEPTGRFSAFDNMQERPIEGSTDWEEYHVVLDVGEVSSAVAFGILLNGDGEVHFAAFRFEEVSTDVPTTGSSPRAAPQNLDFSAG